MKISFKFNAFIKKNETFYYLKCIKYITGKILIKWEPATTLASARPLIWNAH